MSQSVIKSQSVIRSSLKQTLSMLIAQQRQIVSKVQIPCCQSYHEIQYHHLESKNTELLKITQQLQQNINSGILNYVIKNYQQFTSSLFVYSQLIQQILTQFTGISLMHRHHCSQSILLAIYFKCRGFKCGILTTQSNKKSWKSCAIGTQQADPYGLLDSFLEKQQIQVIDLNINASLQKKKYDLLIVDIFNVQFSKYQPVILRMIDQILLSKVIIYHSSAQQYEINMLLNKPENKKLQQFTDILVNPQYPFQYLETDNAFKLIIDFLKQQANHPLNQDLIIFYLSQQAHNLKKYLHKLKDELSKNMNVENVNIISQGNQNLYRHKNNIFVVQSAKQLQQWNYSYKDVFYVIDYGMSKHFKFNYNLMTYVETFESVNSQQNAKRQTYSGVYKIGRYVNTVHNKQYLTTDYILYKDQKDVSMYCLNMIKHGLLNFLDLNNETIKDCINFLIKSDIITKQQVVVNDNKQINFKILNEQVLKYKINPVFSDIILKNSQNKKILNLIIMAIAIIDTPHSLRKISKQVQKGFQKPTTIWKQTGYLHSVLDIITKYQLIQNKAHRSTSSKKSVVKKISSIAQEQFDVFGNMFEQIAPKKLGFEDMTLPDFIRQYFINQSALIEVRDYIDTLRQQFSVEQENIFIYPKDVVDTIIILASRFNNSIAQYSGFRRQGYKIIGQKNSFYPHKESLIGQLNQKPSFIYILRYINNDKINEITLCNTIDESMCFEIYDGKFKIQTRKSNAEAQIQFHGLSSVTFSHLEKHYGYEVRNIEDQYQCLIQPNQQMAIIIIYCDKNKQKQIKQRFEGLLKKIKQKLVIQTKIVNYVGGTSFALGNGGAVKEVISANYVNKCKLTNLSPDCTKEDLYQLFDQFFVIINIQMIRENQFKQAAIITLTSEKQYYRFHSFFHQCMYMDRYINVFPVEGDPRNVTKRASYAKFQWYVWKSHRKAIIEYKKQQDAQNAYKSFENKPIFDNKTIKISIDGCKIYLSDLKQITDQIWLQKDFKKFGEIKYLQISKSPAKQNLGDDHIIDKYIRDTTKDKNIQIVIDPVKKHKNGLRTTNVYFKAQDENKMKNMLAQLHQKPGVIGVSRVYVTERYTYPIVVPKQLMTLYQQLYKEVLEKLHNDTKLVFKVEDEKQGRIYITVKSARKDLLDTFVNSFESSLLGYPIQLSGLQLEIVLNDVGISNLIDLQQKYPCKLIANYLKKTLTVLTPFIYRKKINEQIKFKISQKFFYRIPLNTKSFKHFKANPEKYKQMGKNYHLTLIQLEETSKSIVLEGSAIKVQNALIYMMHIIQSITTPQQLLINADVCGICCQQPNRPYRLQNCGHKFCLQCIVQSIEMVLGDMSMFPIKCPHCLVEVVIGDLQNLLEEATWPRLMNMSANIYVGRNSEVYTFCFTPGCKNVTQLLSDHIKCSLCNRSYCIKCKNNYHKMLTCQQAKQGTDQLFLKFMKQNNIRKCPQKTCGMPIQRIDGCYRVTCNRCGKSMCFKCDSDKMIAYDNYNDCYKHLQDVHGGYW